MNLFIPIYHHPSHSPEPGKAIVAMFIIINLALIGIMIVRATIWITKKERPKIGLFEYAVFSNNVFVSSSVWGMFFFILNGIALLVYLTFLLAPYL